MRTLWHEKARLVILARWGGQVKRWGAIVLAGVMLACGCGNRPRQTEMDNASQRPQKITPLTEDDQKRLREQRAVVEKYVADDVSRQKYLTAAGKLGTIRALLDEKVFKPNQTYELQCLGIVLGDAFAQELKMEWVMVEDESGRGPAVRLPDTTIILYPLTMISKRVERGEKVDVFDLFNWAAAQVEETKKKGY